MSLPVFLDTPIGQTHSRDGKDDDVASDHKTLQAVDNTADVYVDPVIEKRILRKLDLHLAPIFMSLYFLSYLNRSNIGNAAIAGMNDQLGLSPSEYSTAVSVFYATYVGLIFPMVLALRKMKPHRAMTVMAIAWSLVTIGTAFCKSYGALIACRLLLGACEAGFFPCISLYMTMIYNRQEQGLRFAFLFSSMALSGMFGGLVATGITYIGNAGGLRAWSWLYILEGLISLIVVPFVWFGLPENPAQAKFFTPEELEVLAARELRRREYMGSSEFDWAQVRSVLGHWRIYAAASVQFLQDIVLYGFSTFLPSILRNDLGYTKLESQYLSVPVYALGGISFFAAATLGDKYGLRGSILAFLDSFAVVAYLLILLVPSSGVKYFACYLIALPLYCGAGLNEMWIANNTAPHYRRATAIGFSQAIGNLAGIVSGQVYRQAPYHLGNWFSFACTVLAMILIGVQILDFKRLNMRKTKIKSGEIADDRISEEGEHNLEFRYIY